MNRKIAVTESQRLIEQALSDEFLRGETRRTLALAFFFAASIPLTLLHYWLYREQDFLHSAQFAYVFVALVGLITELISWFALRRSERLNRPAWRLGRYLNSLVEMSLPTLALLLSARSIAPERVLGAPASQIYVLLILIGISQLSFRICVFRGLIATVEYLLFVGYFANLVGRIPIQAALAMGEPLADSMVYFASGFAAGIVALLIRRRFIDSASRIAESHQELLESYDTTIEGWSHALDLRDKETEGHCLRVTDMTLLLAKKMGIDSEQQAHMRRGALLHDIGKIGIPDAILHKADKLTAEEWQVMSQHPAIACELLSPIAYLRPALDIPYCHHEKWDGSGYPRGLKGLDIPLSARFFAIVDVWDALRTDRPYHQGWPEEKVLDYIRAQSGTHFDPQAVDLFFRVLSEIPSQPRQSGPVIGLLNK